LATDLLNRTIEAFPISEMFKRLKDPTNNPVKTDSTDTDEKSKAVEELVTKLDTRLEDYYSKIYSDLIKNKSTLAEAIKLIEKKEVEYEIKKQTDYLNIVAEATSKLWKASQSKNTIWVGLAHLTTKAQNQITKAIDKSICCKSFKPEPKPESDTTKVPDLTPEKDSTLPPPSPSPSPSPSLPSGGDSDSGSDGVSKKGKSIKGLKNAAFGLFLIQKANSFLENFINKIDLSLSKIIPSVVESNKFRENIASIAFEQKNFGVSVKETKDVYYEMYASALSSGVEYLKFQENYLKNIQRGFSFETKNDKILNKNLSDYEKRLKLQSKTQERTTKITSSALNTASMLRMSASAMNELFMDWNYHLGLSAVQISSMGRHMQDIAKASGLTGDRLEKAMQNSNTIIKNFQKRGIASGENAKTAMSLSAGAEKTGYENINEFIESISSAEKIIDSDMLRNIHRGALNLVEQGKMTGEEASNFMNISRSGLIVEDPKNLKILKNIIESESELLFKLVDIEIEDLDKNPLAMSDALKDLRGKAKEGDADSQFKVMQIETIMRQTGMEIGEREQLIKILEELPLNTRDALSKASISLKEMEAKNDPNILKTEKYKDQKKQVDSLQTKLYVESFEVLNKYQSELDSSGGDISKLSEKVRKNLESDLKSIYGDDQAGVASMNEFLKDSSKGSEFVVKSLKSRSKDLGVNFNKLLKDQGVNINELQKGLESGNESATLKLQEMINFLNLKEKAKEDPTMEIREILRGWEHYFQSGSDNFLKSINPYLAAFSNFFAIILYLASSFVTLFPSIFSFFWVFNKGLKLLSPTIHKSIKAGFSNLWRGIKTIFSGSWKHILKILLNIWNFIKTGKLLASLATIGTSITTALGGIGASILAVLPYIIIAALTVLLGLITYYLTKKLGEWIVGANKDKKEFDESIEIGKKQIVQLEELNKNSNQRQLEEIKGMEDPQERIKSLEDRKDTLTRDVNFHKSVIDFETEKIEGWKNSWFGSLGFHDYKIKESEQQIRQSEGILNAKLEGLKDIESALKQSQNIQQPNLTEPNIQNALIDSKNETRTSISAFELQGFDPTKIETTTKDSDFSDLNKTLNDYKNEPIKSIDSFESKAVDSVSALNDSAFNLEKSTSMLAVDSASALNDSAFNLEKSTSMLAVDSASALNDSAFNLEKSTSMLAVDSASALNDSAFNLEKSTLSLLDSAYSLNDSAFNLGTAASMLAFNSYSLNDSAFNLEKSTLSLLDSAYSLNDSAFNLATATSMLEFTSSYLNDSIFNLEISTLSLLDSAYSLNDSAFNLEKSTLSLLDSAYSLNDSAFNLATATSMLEFTSSYLNDSIFNLEISTLSLLDSAYSLNDSAFNLGTATSMLEFTSSYLNDSIFNLEISTLSLLDSAYSLNDSAFNLGTATSMLAFNSYSLNDSAFNLGTVTSMLAVASSSLNDSAFNLLTATSMLLFSKNESITPIDVFELDKIGFNEPILDLLKNSLNVYGNISKSDPRTLGMGLFDKENNSEANDKFIESFIYKHNNAINEESKSTKDKINYTESIGSLLKNSLDIFRNISKSNPITLGMGLFDKENNSEANDKFIESFIYKHNNAINEESKSTKDKINYTESIGSLLKNSLDIFRNISKSNPITLGMGLFDKENVKEAEYFTENNKNKLNEESYLSDKTITSLIKGAIEEKNKKINSDALALSLGLFDKDNAKEANNDYLNVEKSIGINSEYLNDAIKSSIELKKNSEKFEKNIVSETNKSLNYGSEPSDYANKTFAKTNMIDYRDEMKGEVGSLSLSRIAAETAIEQEKYANSKNGNTSILPSMDSIADYLVSEQAQKLDKMIAVMEQIRDKMSTNKEGTEIIKSNDAALKTTTRTGIKNSAKDFNRGSWDLTFGDYSPGVVTID